MVLRQVTTVMRGHPASDGAGVKLTRIFGGVTPEQFDPFLLLDEFGSDEVSDYMAGFPSHPHRGFETVTYMLEGRMLHEDHLGNQGLLKDGDVQWMTAARGIIHSEMPQQTAGRMRGFQLWVNLPANEKMKDPAYQDIPAHNIPEIAFGGVSVKAIAGETQINDQSIIGAVSGITTQPLYLDVHFSAAEQLDIPVPEGYTTLVYVYEGSVNIGDPAHKIDHSHLAVLNDQGVVCLTGEAQTRLILLAGKPLNEPVVQHGPFVMNTQQEIEQAIQDYRDGSLVAVRD